MASTAERPASEQPAPEPSTAAPGLIDSPVARFVRGAARRGRRSAAEAIRTRIAGNDHQQRNEQIWFTPGERQFAADDPICRVHNDPAMFSGGLSALLLQSLHPIAMAGVAGHSGYRGDPWGRLSRTSDYIASTTFGTIDEAERAIAQVRSIHARVRGKDHLGRAYSADDPHLLGWIHAAEATSFLTAYQTYAPRPLTEVEADAYVAQLGSVAARLGVLDPPDSVAALARLIDDYRPELYATPDARDTAQYLLFSPPLPVPARGVYAGLAAGAVGLLPGWARRELRLPAVPAGNRAIGALSTSLTRWVLAAPG